jgi:hypothetical protein
MSRLAQLSKENNTLFHHRIMANLQVQASWVDAVSGKTVLVDGMTENVGENTALINLQTLPPVGSEVTLRIIDKEKTIVEVPTQVIRVERNPSKPLAALSVLENLKNWKQIALTAAQTWVSRNLRLNYDYKEEWVN